VTKTQTKENNLLAIHEHDTNIIQILQNLDQQKDMLLYRNYQIQLSYLNNLQHCINTTEHTQIAGFSSPDNPETITTQNVPPRSQPLFTPQTSIPIPHIRPKPTFYTEVNNTRSISKDLVSILDPGDEIQWARLTQTTLEEYPHIDDKLKLKALTQQLAKHQAAKQAAAAQLLQTIQDPTHNPLQGFFTWLHQSYGLTPQEQNTQLRKAIEQQKFDWTSNPAIDLQNAISQVHMGLPEINTNEIFRETLKDALKYKLQPYYHLVADTPITQLPDRLRFIWKKLLFQNPTLKRTKNRSNPLY